MTDLKNIDKTSGGLWRVRVSHQGRRILRTFNTQHEAKEFRDMLKGKRTDDPGARLEDQVPKRFDECAISWFNGHKLSVKPSTRQRYRDNLNKNILPFFGLMDMNRITTREIKEWQGWLVRERNLSGSTILLARNVLSMIYKDAMISGDTSGPNPVRDVPRVAIEPKRVEIIKQEDIDRIADEIIPRYKLLIYMAGYMGLRSGELAFLRLSDIDMEKRTLSVNGTRNYVDKGWVDGQPKTRKSYRTLPMPQFIFEALLEHIESGYTLEDKWVFTNGDGRGRLAPPNFRELVWVKILAELDIPYVKVHSLRHSAITMWLMNGINPKVVAKWAGHKSVAYVLDTYVHLLGDEDWDSAKKIDEMHSLRLAS